MSTVSDEKYLRLVLVAMEMEAKKIGLSQGVAYLSVHALGTSSFTIHSKEIGEGHSLVACFAKAVQDHAQLIGQARNPQTVRLLQSRLMHFDSGMMALKKGDLIIVGFVGGDVEENLRVTRLGLGMILSPYDREEEV